MMMGQSSTRQAQIEELRKKLIEAAKEANDLKWALKLKLGHPKRIQFRTEILKYRKSNNSEPQTTVKIGVCMNCIVMQQALTMANTALKGNIIAIFIVCRLGIS